MYTSVDYKHLLMYDHYKMRTVWFALCFFVTAHAAGILPIWTNPDAYPGPITNAFFNGIATCSGRGYTVVFSTCGYGDVTCAGFTRSDTSADQNYLIGYDTKTGSIQWKQLWPNAYSSIADSCAFEPNSGTFVTFGFFATGPTFGIALVSQYTVTGAFIKNTTLFQTDGDDFTIGFIRPDPYGHGTIATVSSIDLQLFFVYILRSDLTIASSFNNSIPQSSAILQPGVLTDGSIAVGFSITSLFEDIYFYGILCPGAFADIGCSDVVVFNRTTGANLTQWPVAYGSSGAYLSVDSGTDSILVASNGVTFPLLNNPTAINDTAIIRYNATGHVHCNSTFPFTGFCDPSFVNCYSFSLLSLNVSSEMLFYGQGDVPPFNNSLRIYDSNCNYTGASYTFNNSKFVFDDTVGEDGNVYAVGVTGDARDTLFLQAFDVNGQCPPGYYCSTGQVLICPAGFYCQGGAFSDVPIPCPAVLAYCPAGSSSSGPCPINYCCPNNTIAVRCHVDTVPVWLSSLPTNGVFVATAFDSNDELGVAVVAGSTTGDLLGVSFAPYIGVCSPCSAVIAVDLKTNGSFLWAFIESSQGAFDGVVLQTPGVGTFYVQLVQAAVDRGSFFWLLLGNTGNVVNGFLWDCQNGLGSIPTFWEVESVSPKGNGNGMIISGRTNCLTNVETFDPTITWFIAVLDQLGTAIQWISPVRPDDTKFDAVFYAAESIVGDTGIAAYARITGPDTYNGTTFGAGDHYVLLAYEYGGPFVTTQQPFNPSVGSGVLQSITPVHTGSANPNGALASDNSQTVWISDQSNTIVSTDVAFVAKFTSTSISSGYNLTSLYTNASTISLYPVLTAVPDIDWVIGARFVEAAIEGYVFLPNVSAGPSFTTFGTLIPSVNVTEGGGVRVTASVFALLGSVIGNPGNATVIETFLCTPGYFCTDSFFTSFLCTAGSYCPGAYDHSAYLCPTTPNTYYCPPGSSSLTLCPFGFFCPNNTVAIPCGGGCPAGQYCPFGGTNTTCPIGSYCPAGTCAPISCPLSQCCNSLGLGAPQTCPPNFFLHNCTIAQQYADCNQTFDSNCLVDCSNLPSDTPSNSFDPCLSNCYALYTNTTCSSACSNIKCVHECQLFHSQPQMSACLNNCSTSQCLPTKTTYLCGSYPQPTRLCNTNEFLSSCAVSTDLCFEVCTDQLRTVGCRPFTECFWETSQSFKTSAKVPLWFDPIGCGADTFTQCGSTNDVGCLQNNCSFTNAVGYVNCSLIPGTCTPQPALTHCRLDFQTDPPSSCIGCVESCNAVVQNVFAANRVEVPNIPCEQACNYKFMNGACAQSCATSTELQSSCIKLCGNTPACAAACSSHFANTTCVYGCYLAKQTSLDSCLSTCNSPSPTCGVDNNYLCAAQLPTLAGNYFLTCNSSAYNNSCAHDPLKCQYICSDFNRQQCSSINHQQCFWADDFDFGNLIPSDFPSMPCPNADIFCGAGFTQSHPSNLCRITQPRYTNALGFYNGTLVPGTCKNGTYEFLCSAAISIGACHDAVTGESIVNPTCSLQNVPNVICFNGFQPNDILLYAYYVNCMDISCVAGCASPAEVAAPCYQSCINSTSDRCLTRCMFGWADQACVGECTIVDGSQFECAREQYNILDNCFYNFANPDISDPCGSDYFDIYVRYCSAGEFNNSCVPPNTMFTDHLCTESCSDIDRTDNCNYFITPMLLGQLSRPESNIAAKHPCSLQR